MHPPEIQPRLLTPDEIDGLTREGREVHIEDLPMIDVTPNASGKEFQGYPPDYRKHPERNHPALVRYLIDHYSKFRDHVHDPQMGCGTVLVEAARKGRVATGFDLVPEFRDRVNKWIPRYREKSGTKLRMEVTDDLPKNSVDLVISSPSYFDTTHDAGGGAYQAMIHESIGSMQGAGWDVELPPGHLATARRIATWIHWVKPVMKHVAEVLKPGGRVAWIVRDKIDKGKPNQFTVLNVKLLHQTGLKPVGAHLRKITPSGRQRLQAEKFRKTHGFYPLLVSREAIIIFEKEA